MLPVLYAWQRLCRGQKAQTRLIGKTSLTMPISCELMQKTAGAQVLPDLDQIMTSLQLHTYMAIFQMA